MVIVTSIDVHSYIYSSYLGPAEFCARLWLLLILCAVFTNSARCFGRLTMPYCLVYGCKFVYLLVVLNN